MLKIQIILGSTREARKSESVGAFVFEIVKRNKEAEFELIDLKDWPLPFYQEVAGASSLNGNYSIDLAKKWAKKVSEADGYLVITPEYNHGYPAVLKNALDYAYKEWNKKPIGFIAYGGAVGGARSVEQLRLVAIELQMVPIREAVYIPFIWDAFDEEGRLEDDKFEERVNKTVVQLVWWAKVLKVAREKDLSTV